MFTVSDWITVLKDNFAQNKWTSLLFLIILQKDYWLQCDRLLIRINSTGGGLWMKSFTNSLHNNLSKDTAVYSLTIWIFFLLYTSRHLIFCLKQSRKMLKKFKSNIQEKGQIFRDCSNWLILCWMNFWKKHHLVKQSCSQCWISGIFFRATWSLLSTLLKFTM